jgi:hypothetical protein
MSYSVYEIAKNIRRILLNRTAEVIVYDWSKDFSVDQIKNVVEYIRSAKWFIPVNPIDMDEEQLIDLGFQKWSEENPVYLIPLWLFPFLPEEVELRCINGEKNTLKKADMDNDNRFGCLAYGVIPKKNDGGLK